MRAACLARPLRRLSALSGPFLPPAAQSTGGLPTLTLCLDLDECLVHCSTEDKSCTTFQELMGPEAARAKAADAGALSRHGALVAADAEFHLPYLCEPVRLHKRPLLQDFLVEARKLCELVLFTSATDGYVEQCAPLIEPAPGTFSAVLTRKHCTERDALYVKDLSLLGRPLERVVLLDDNPASFMLHPDNGVPILPWFGGAEDRELTALLPLLRSLQGDADVRPRLRQAYQLQEKLVDGLRTAAARSRKIGGVDRR